MMINRLFRKLMFGIKDTYIEIKRYFESPLRLEEIDVNKKIVILRSRGVRAILKLTIAEAVTDLLIVENLLPIQACWLGYYAGQLHEEFGKEKKNILFGGKVGAFKLSYKKGRYKIVSQNRNGTIEYIDTITNIVSEDWPFDIARNQKIISGFDPSQACYIGILVGVNTNKVGKKQSVDKRSQAMLRVIK